MELNQVVSLDLKRIADALELIAERLKPASYTADAARGVWLGWVEHDGSECPIPGNVKVEVRLRDGFKPSPDKAAGFAWIHGEPNAGDIVAYRVVT